MSHDSINDEENENIIDDITYYFLENNINIDNESNSNDKKEQLTLETSTASTVNVLQNISHVEDVHHHDNNIYAIAHTAMVDGIVDNFSYNMITSDIGSSWWELVCGVNCFILECNQF